MLPKKSSRTPLAALCLLTAFAVTPALLAAPAKKPAAADKKKAKDEKPSDAEPPMAAKPIKLVPEGMRWGMSKGELEKLMDKFIDQDYKQKYKDAGASSTKIKDLDNEVAAKKAAFKKAAIDLVPGPSGLDASPLANEFTKGNGEMLISHQRGPGVRIWFFFIGGRLWKTIEEVSFVKGGLYGDDISGAVKMIVDGVGGTDPRHIPSNPDKGQYADVFDWNDKDTHMRMWDRSGTLVIAREERTTLGNLANLRKASTAKKDQLDPAVAAALQGGGAPSPSTSAPPKGK